MLPSLTFQNTLGDFPESLSTKHPTELKSTVQAPSMLTRSDFLPHLGDKRSCRTSQHPIPLVTVIQDTFLDASLEHRSVFSTTGFQDVLKRCA